MSDTPESDEILDNEGNHACLFSRLRETERERDTLQAAVDEFCKKHEWAADTWKRQSYIAELFNLRKP
jgi:hypothetical protein